MREPERMRRGRAEKARHEREQSEKSAAAREAKIATANPSRSSTRTESEWSKHHCPRDVHGQVTVSLHLIRRLFEGEAVLTTSLGDRPDLQESGNELPKQG